ncbi:MAG: helix-turn-helix transcriptional regulator [Chloroflexales bacterium]|nr:helix-turn-helix transcriptional regulator [Chloroflexales bacterium]
MEESTSPPLHEEATLLALIAAVRDFAAAHSLVDPQQWGQDRAAPPTGQRLAHDLAPVWDCLTPREHDVAWRLIDGLSNETIAAQLKINPQTVRTHVRNIMRKLGVNNRGAAIVLLLQHLPNEQRP